MPRHQMYWIIPVPDPEIPGFPPGGGGQLPHPEHPIVYPPGTQPPPGGGGPGQPPGIWGPTDPRPTPPISGIPGLPGYEPPAGGGPGRPPGTPPGFWGGGPHPMPPINYPEPPSGGGPGGGPPPHPEHPIPPIPAHPIVLPPWKPTLPPDLPPWDGPKPSHPIVLPGDPSWGDPHPEHPIVLPPGTPPDTRPPGEVAHPIIPPAPPGMVWVAAIIPGNGIGWILIPIPTGDYPSHPIIEPPPPGKQWVCIYLPPPVDAWGWVLIDIPMTLLADYKAPTGKGKK